MTTPLNNRNKYINFCFAYIYRDYFILKTDLINDDCSV